MANAKEKKDEQGPRRVPLNPNPALLVGIVAIVVTFGGFGTWAAVAPLASAVIAPGFVKVDSNRKKVQHLEGGTVATLQVRDGDRVEQGQVLLQLDETRARATLAILQARYDTARAVQARLLAERDGAEAIAWPDDMDRRSQEPDVGAVLSGQQSLFDARRISLRGESEILGNRIAQLADDIKGIEAQQRAKERQIDLIHEEAESVKLLLDQGHTDRPRYLALQREMARLEGERGEHVSAIARTANEIGETRLQVIQLERAFKEQVETDLRAVADELVDLQERRIAAQHTLNHIEIRAPVTGTVVGLSVHTVGGVIAPGATVLEIVPLDDQLIVEAQVQPNDIDDLAIGQSADVNFSGFKQRNAPVLIGQVVYRSADRLMNERTGEPFYLVHVAVTDEQLERLGDHRLQPGMPADVMIKTGERTALEYLFQPLLDSLDHAWREE